MINYWIFFKNDFKLKENSDDEFFQLKKLSDAKDAIEDKIKELINDCLKEKSLDEEELM